MSLGLGIDVGATTVTVCAIKKSGGAIALEHYRVYPRAELGDGEDLESIARALSNELARDGFRSRRCVLGVSGRDAIIRYSHLPPMPDWRLALLMDFEIFFYYLLVLLVFFINQVSSMKVYFIQI